MNTAPLTTAYQHITVGADGVPYVEGTTMKVIELVMAQYANGWSPEELHFQYPHLSLGQIYSALAFYWDHKFSLDAEIERTWQSAEKASEDSRPSPLAAKLRAKGLPA